MTAAAAGAAPGSADLDTAIAELFGRDALAQSIVWRVVAVCGAAPGLSVKPAKTQLALCRRKTFALLWPVPAPVRRPGSPPVVLSIALAREVNDRRIKQVSHPGENHWLHHIELWSPEAVDEAVRGWLREAVARAG